MAPLHRSCFFHPSYLVTIGILRRYSSTEKVEGLGHSYSCRFGRVVVEGAGSLAAHGVVLPSVPGIDQPALPEESLADQSSLLRTPETRSLFYSIIIDTNAPLSGVSAPSSVPTNRTAVPDGPVSISEDRDCQVSEYP